MLLKLRILYGVRSEVESLKFVALNDSEPANSRYGVSDVATRCMSA